MKTEKVDTEGGQKPADEPHVPPEVCSENTEVLCNSENGTETSRNSISRRQQFEQLNEEPLGAEGGEMQQPPHPVLNLEFHDLPPEIRQKLDDFFCIICYESMIEATLACRQRHKFCGYCLTHWIEVRGDQRCPLCRGQITATTRIPLPELDTEIAELFASLSEDMQLARAAALRERREAESAPAHSPSPTPSTTPELTTDNNDFDFVIFDSLQRSYQMLMAEEDDHDELFGGAVTPGVENFGAEFYPDRDIIADDAVVPSPFMPLHNDEIHFFQQFEPYTLWDNWIDRNEMILQQIETVANSRSLERNVDRTPSSVNQVVPEIEQVYQPTHPLELSDNYLPEGIYDVYEIDTHEQQYADIAVRGSLVGQLNVNANYSRRFVANDQNATPTHSEPNFVASESNHRQGQFLTPIPPHNISHFHYLAQTYSPNAGDPSIGIRFDTSTPHTITQGQIPQPANLQLNSYSATVTNLPNQSSDPIYTATANPSIPISNITNRFLYDERVVPQPRLPGQVLHSNGRNAESFPSQQIHLYNNGGLVPPQQTSSNNLEMLLYAAFTLSRAWIPFFTPSQFPLQPCGSSQFRHQPWSFLWQSQQRSYESSWPWQSQPGHGEPLKQWGSQQRHSDTSSQFQQQPCGSSSPFQQPRGSSSQSIQQPWGSSSQFQQQPYGSPSQFQQRPWDSSSQYPQQPYRSSPINPQQPWSLSSQYPEQPCGSSLESQQQPCSSSYQYPHQYWDSSSQYSLLPYRLSPQYPQQPWGSSSQYPQQPWGPSAQYRQQPWGSSSQYPQQPWGPSAQYRQQPWGSSSQYPQQPWGPSAQYRQQPWGSPPQYPQQAYVTQPQYPQQPYCPPPNYTRQIYDSQRQYAQQYREPFTQLQHLNNSMQSWSWQRQLERPLQRGPLPPQQGHQGGSNILGYILVRKSSH